MDTTRVLHPPRHLTLWEHDVLEALLAVPFPGSEELREQLGSVAVSEEYGGGDPSVIFEVARHVAPSAPVRRRIPVEAEGPDEDGTTIHVLLHVVDGYGWELELFRPDGNDVKRAPDARSLVLFSPDHQEQGREQPDRIAG